MHKVLLIFTFLLIFILAGCQCDGYVNSYITYNNYDDSDKYNIGSIKYTESIETLKINWKAGKVEVLETQDNTILIEEINTLEEKQKVRSRIKNNELVIHFWESGYASKVESEKKTLKVYVPNDINIIISSTSGDVYNSISKAKKVTIDVTSASIKMDQIECDSLSLASTSGTITTDDVTSDKIDICSTSGSLNLKVMTAENITVSTTSGKITIKEINGMQCQIGSNSGKVVIGKNKVNRIDITTTSGSINIYLDETETYDLNTTSGTVEIGVLSSSFGKVFYSSTSGSFKTGGIKTLYDGVCYQIGTLESEKNIIVNTTSGSLKLYEVN